MNRIPALFASLIFFLSLPVGLHAKGDPAADALWNQIVAMDAGPAQTPKNREQAARQVRDHLVAHQALVERFISEYPKDPRQFEARLRQAALISSRATLENDRHALERAYRLLSDLERVRGLTKQQASNASFQRISVLFLQARGNEERMREAVVNAATNFHSRYPTDPRGPRLLAEAAAICDSIPRTKRALLETALRDTREESLKARVRDDLRRMDLVGQTFPLTFPTLDGKSFRLQDHEGKIVVLIFWSAESPHSLLWMQDFLRENAGLFGRANSPVLASLSLDSEKAPLVEMVKEMNIGFPVGFDGRGWENETARQLGINAVPTVWIFDKRGRLRTVNAKQNVAAAVRQLSSE